MPKQAKNNKKKNKKVSRARPQKNKSVPLLKAQKIKFPKTPSLPPITGGVVGIAKTPVFPGTYYKVAGYNDVKSGIKNGVRLQMCGPIFLCELDGGTRLGYKNTLASGAPVTVGGTVGFPVNPHYIIPRDSPGAIALAYSRFQFKSLKLHWVGMAATNNTDGIALAYTPDGGVAPADYATFNSYMPLEVASYISCWNSVSLDCTNSLNTKDLFYIDDDSGLFATDAGYRESYQGIVMLHPNAALEVDTVAGTIGLLYAEFDLLCVETQPFGQNLVASLSGEERVPPPRAPRERKMKAERKKAEPVRSGSEDPVLL